MDEDWTFAEIVRLARAFLDKERSALQTATSIASLGLVHLPCWDALGGVQGPLGALYAADDDAQKQHFLGDDVEKWHPSVIQEKRAALMEAEQFWASGVRTACDALIAYAATRDGTQATITGVAVDDTDAQFEKIVSGAVRPPLIPQNWIGEAVSPGKMWRWHDPDNPRNSVTFCRGDPLSAVINERQDYVLVYRDGIPIGRDGKPLRQ